MTDLTGKTFTNTKTGKVAKVCLHDNGAAFLYFRYATGPARHMSVGKFLKAFAAA